MLHGGGNSSVKGTWENVLGERAEALYVKASGMDMAEIEPEGHPGLDLAYLLRLRRLPGLDDESMVNELRTHLLRADSPTPSLEALVHAFIPRTYVDHTHADAVLALTNRPDGSSVVRQALGDDVLVLDYVTPGFKLAQATVAALESRPQVTAMVWSHHGVVTWGETARESYEAMIDVVSRAESHLAGMAKRSGWLSGRDPAPHADDRRAGEPVPQPRDQAERAAAQADGASVELARARAFEVAPLVRGMLAQPEEGPDKRYRRMLVLPLVTTEALDLLASPGAKELVLTGPLTTDHLIRTKALPAWVDDPAYDRPDVLREQVHGCVADYATAYEAYVDRHAALMPAGMQPFDSLPRVLLLPGLGALCAGRDLREATIVRDITAHTLSVKALVGATGSYLGLPEEELFAMEYRTLQRAKLAASPAAPLAGHVAIVTGAAGAIGAGIAQGLLEQGCTVAVTDLPGDALDGLTAELGARYRGRVMGVPLDVTDAESVARAFAEVALAWGGVDLVVANAGIAMVAPLEELELESFRRLERVNVEGTLLVLAQSARHFKHQGTGGDIVLVSTKNVFAPGAKFGAYSATKAAAHQLARIASLEMAEHDVRVNMIAPDAVFGHGARRSGLWAEVGPDRMRARGLDEAGLEAYYRSRNLLKVAVTAEHVANAVLYFATRQTPTTGATIPVDGGLPDSTPR